MPVVIAEHILTYFRTAVEAAPKQLPTLRHPYATVSLKTKKRIDLQLSEAQPRQTITHNKVVRDAGEILIHTDVSGEAGGIMQRAKNWPGTLGIVWSCTTEYDLEMPPSESGLSIL